MQDATQHTSQNGTTQNKKESRSRAKIDIIAKIDLVICSKKQKASKYSNC